MSSVFCKACGFKYYDFQGHTCEGSTQGAMTDPTRAEVERLANWQAAREAGTFVRWSDYAALRERAEAAEAERDRQYDENVHRIAMQARAENERDDARRAEAAAWNDAIEAAAAYHTTEIGRLERAADALDKLGPNSDPPYTERGTAALRKEACDLRVQAGKNLAHWAVIRALRRAAPTEDLT